MFQHVKHVHVKVSLDRELQSYAVSEGEGKYETAVSHGYIGYGINVALAHEGLSCCKCAEKCNFSVLVFSTAHGTPLSASHPPPKWYHHIA